MYISKNQIVRRIRKAAKNYKNYLVGRTFMFVYDDKCLEVMFKTSSFFHLTGVGSKLSAKNFYKHAISGNELKASEIYFDSDHPFDLVDLKTQYLKDLYKITITDVLIADDIITATTVYEIGITNIEIVLCLGKDTDKFGNVISDRWVPYSFRVENIDNKKYDKLYEVLWIFSKDSNNLKYDKLSFGNIDKIDEIPDAIKTKISTENLEDN